MESRQKIILDAYIKNILIRGVAKAHLSKRAGKVLIDLDAEQRSAVNRVAEKTKIKSRANVIRLAIDRGLTILEKQISAEVSV